jgi:hypothetical protein
VKRVAGQAIQREEAWFFLERKNQRTFFISAGAAATAPIQTDKVFLLLFLQKKKTLPIDFYPFYCFFAG